MAKQSFYELSFDELDILNAAKKIKEADEGTWIFPLKQDFDTENNWAIVVGFAPGFSDYENDDDYWQVCGKVAYQSKKSVMQEYDIDWIMPYSPYEEEKGLIYDTEIQIGNICDCQCLIKSWIDYLEGLERRRDMYYWEAECEDGAYDDESQVYFKTKKEAYDSMRNAALEKMKWNTEYDEDFEENDCINYEVEFYKDKIVHRSYSGTYTWKLKTKGE